MDMRPGAGITTAQSDEHQRRWTEQRWEQALKDGNYDRSREHLNFEVTRGGKVRSVDKSRSIPERFQERLRQLGIEDPNKGRRIANRRTVANFIFGGSRERMNELAFGDQPLDLRRGADNSHLRRRPEIELWAQDVYRFVCDQWGEDNIIGFYVHLDETNPHIHCTLMPVLPNGRLSYKELFAGRSKWEYRQKIEVLPWLRPA